MEFCWHSRTNERSCFWLGEGIHLTATAGFLFAPLPGPDFIRRRMIHPNLPFDTALCRA